VLAFERSGVTDFTSRFELAPDAVSLSVLELPGKMPLIFSFIQSQAEHSALADVQRIAIANIIMPSVRMLPPAVNLSCDIDHHSLLRLSISLMQRLCPDTILASC
jgi:hypothetical protein